MSRPIAWLWLLSVVCVVRASAQTTAISQNIDTSIRAAGMGGASVAVDWGEPGVWGNPASLAGAEGVTWIQGRTRLLPGLASDVFFDSRRLLLGGSGVGVSVMGKPFEGVGRTRLDYGEGELTDPFGNPIGTFSAHEQIEGWGVGFSPLRIAEAMRGGHGPRWSERFDLAFGFQRKHTQVVLAPAALGGTASSVCDDLGARASVALLPGDVDGAAPQLDLSLGFAILNANDAEFRFGTTDVGPARMRRMGFAVHTAWPLTPGAHDAGGAWGWWLGRNPRTLGVAVAFDHDHVAPTTGGGGYDVQHYGFEATALGIVTGRVGYWNDEQGQITDTTLGFGIHLPLGPWAAAGYDFASMPQANDSGLPRLKRHGWSVWLDPWGMLRGER